MTHPKPKTVYDCIPSQGIAFPCKSCGSVNPDPMKTVCPACEPRCSACKGALDVYGVVCVDFQGKERRYCSTCQLNIKQWNAAALEHVDATVDATAPKFKPGDRVRVVKSHPDANCVNEGETGVVLEVNPAYAADSSRVKVKHDQSLKELCTYEWEWLDDNLELIEPAPLPDLNGFVCVGVFDKEPPFPLDQKVIAEALAHATQQAPENKWPDPPTLADFDAAVRRWLVPLLPASVRVVTDVTEEAFVGWVLERDVVLHEFTCYRDEEINEAECEYVAEAIAVARMRREVAEK
jgi:hypothetical protein